MLSLKETVLIKVGEVVFHQAKKEANSACPYFHNQPKLPEEVKKLREFRKYDRF